jgi:REP element-mobilizing transposase RayT
MFKRPFPRKEKIHWLDQTYYFLTSSTFLHYPYFKTDIEKNICLRFISEIENKLGISVAAFSIAINHVHLLFYLEKGETMTKLKNYFHSGISREYRKAYKCPYPEFWQPSKTLYVKDEAMFWKVTGYIIGNLIKHKEIGTFGELMQCPYSSFSRTVAEIGEEEARNLVYRVIEVPETADGEVDLARFGGIDVPIIGASGRGLG